MSSKFENFDIGRAVARLLNIKDPKNFPVHLNTDELQGVLSIPGPGGFLTEITGQNNFDPSGANSSPITIVGPVESTPLIVSPGMDLFIDDLSILTTVTGGGAIAMNGKNITVFLAKLTAVGAQNIYCYYDAAAFQIATGTVGYFWTLRNCFNLPDKAHAQTAGRGILVAKGQQLIARVSVSDGTLWPAGSLQSLTIDAYTDNGMGTLRPY